MQNGPDRKKQRKGKTDHAMTKSEAASYNKMRTIKYVLFCLVAGLIIPVTCIVLAVVLLDPSVEDGNWSLCFIAPAGISLSFVGLVTYRERGPGGVLEHRGYKVGCLPCTALSDEERADMGGK